MGSSVAASPRLQSTVRFYQAPVGKKIIVAVTGIILFGFVCAHLLGNLQVFLGPEHMNAYARFLHQNVELLWGARIVLLASVILHIVTTVQLALVKSKARPVSYVRKVNAASTYASRTMIWSGPIIFAFVGYHLLHFTLGTVHPNFQEDNGIPLAYQNLVTGFQNPLVAVSYMIAMTLLGTHLYHGAWSMFQSLGISHPRYTPMLKRFAAGISIALTLGFLSIPAAILAGLVRLP